MITKSIKIIRLFIFFTAILFLLTNSLEAKPLGTESGGGGSVYRDNDGDLKLLDFKAVNYKSSYFYHLFSENHIVETEESFLFNEKQNSSVFKKCWSYNARVEQYPPRYYV